MTNPAAPTVGATEAVAWRGITTPRVTSAKIVYDSKGIILAVLRSCVCNRKLARHLGNHDARWAMRGHHGEFGEGIQAVGRIIDIHAHVFPDEVAVSAMPALEEEGGVRSTFDGTVAGLLSEMDRAGIEIAVTQPVATKPSQVTRINDWAASTASERIIPFGGLHPDTPDPAAEVARLAELGIRGIKLHPEYQRFRPDEERMWPIYETVIEHGLVILFHAGLDIGIPTDLGRPDSFARLLDRYPELPAILAHMGGWRLWDEVWDHLVGRNVLFDTSYARGHMTDDAFLGLVMAHGARRVLFGTDGPWADMPAEVAWLQGLPLAPDDIESIMGGNAKRLLGL